jgi:hypothetical protein
MYTKRKQKQGSAALIYLQDIGPGAEAEGLS